MNLINIMTRIEYNPRLKERSKILRKNMTTYEKKLWFGFLKILEKEQNIRVLRQRIINNFIVDFYIASYKLVIEIDGDNHYEKQQMVYDRERTLILEGLGLKVIRYTNHEIKHNFDGVCKNIIDTMKTLPLSPPQGGGSEERAGGVKNLRTN